MANDTEIDPELMDDPVFQRVMADAAAMQDRFSAEPVYAKTGKGSLESAGVAELAALKIAMRKNEADNEFAEKR